MGIITAFINVCNAETSCFTVIPIVMLVVPIINALIEPLYKSQIYSSDRAICDFLGDCYFTQFLYCRSDSKTTYLKSIH